MKKSDIRNEQPAIAVTGNLFGAALAGQAGVSMPGEAAPALAQRRKFDPRRDKREEADEPAAVVDFPEQVAGTDSASDPAFDNLRSPFAQEGGDPPLRYAQAETGSRTDAPSAAADKAPELEVIPGDGESGLGRTSTKVMLGGAVLLGAAAAGGGGGGGGGGSSTVDTVTPRVEKVEITNGVGAQNNFLNAGDVVEVTVTTSRSVVVTGVPTIDLNIGGTVVKAEYARGSGTTELVFTYTIQAGQNDADGISVVAGSLFTNPLHGIRIRDSANGYDIALAPPHAGIANDPGYMVDTVAPGPVTIDTPIAGDNIINKNEETSLLSGTCETGSIVVLTLGSVTRTAETIGSRWSYELTAADVQAIGQGQRTFTATPYDLAGNVGAAASQAVTIDTNVIAASIDAVAGDNIINAAEAAAGVTITGKGKPGATVTLTFDSGLTLAGGNTAIVDASGNWSKAVTSADIAFFGQGAETITARQVDTAGNVTVGSRTITVDTVVAVPALDLAAVSDSGVSNTDNITNVTTPIFTITGEPGADVTLFNDLNGNGRVDSGETLGTVTLATATGTIQSSPLAQGVYNAIKVIQIDAAGNTSTASTAHAPITIDTSALAPTLDLQDASDTGASPTDNITNDTTPTFTVMGEVGATVTLFNDANDNGVVDVGESLGTVTLTATTGAITSSALAPGVYSNIKVIQTDLAGNTSPASAAHPAITIDTTTPTLNVQTFAYDENRTAGATVATVAASDNLGVTGFAFTATGTATSADGYFQISNTGVITLTAAGAASAANNFEAAPNSWVYGITARDAAGNTTSANVTLNENNLNDNAPVNSVPGAQTTTEDTARVFSSANGNAITVSDADSGTLNTTVSVTNGILTAVAFAGATITNNGTGSVTIAGTAAAINGALNGSTYTPTADFNGSATLTVVTSDGTASDTDAVTINITAVADIVNDTATTNEDTVVNIAVLANDTFENAGRAITAVNGSAVTAGGSAVPVANGTVALNGAGTELIFTPAANYNGPASFTYTVTSGGVTETATVSVTVNAVNDPTIVTGGTSGSGNEDGGAITGTLTATDADGLADGTVFTVSGAAAHGTASINAATGAWTYTPVADYYGSDSFTVTITDDANNTTTQAVSLTINPVADIVNDSVSTILNTPITFNAVTGTNGASADNFENLSWAVTAVTNGSHGTVAFVFDGTLTYTPNTGYIGTDTFTYTVTAGGVTEIGNVTVSVI